MSDEVVRDLSRVLCRGVSRAERKAQTARSSAMTRPCSLRAAGFVPCG